MTDFQIDHPGGPDVLQDVAAQDASEEFENILHTEKARNMAKKYLIGKVKGTVPGDLFSNEYNKMNNAPPPDQIDSKQSSISSSTVLLGIVLIVLGIVYFWNSKKTTNNFND